MAKYTKQDKKIKEYDQNPSFDRNLLEAFVVEKKKFVRNPVDTAKLLEVQQDVREISKTNPVASGFLFAEKIEVDTQTFVKFYADGLNSIFGLSNSAVNVFQTIYKKVLNNHNNDVVGLLYTA